MRNHVLEDEVLNFGVDLCDRAYTRAPTGFITEVKKRLALGAERYGDDDYLTKDNLAESMEETPDLAAYAVLELEKLCGDLDPGDCAELRMDVVAVVAAAAHAHALLQQLHARRREFLG